LKHLSFKFFVYNIGYRSNAKEGIPMNQKNAGRKRRRAPSGAKLWLLPGVLAAACLCAILVLVHMNQRPSSPQPSNSGAIGSSQSSSSSPAAGTSVQAEETTSAQPEPTADPGPFFTGTAQACDSAKISNINLRYRLLQNGSLIDSYKRDTPLNFGAPEAYSSLEGVISFRGNNFRNGGSYGTSSVSQYKMETIWTKRIGAIDKWTGVGWNGQPVMVRWSAQQREAMNLKSDKKTKDGLVEVIYGTLDGKIYFLDAEDGTPTRDPINLGYSIKGSVSIDPRGYPLLYVGQGIPNNGDKRNTIGWRIYSLVDQAELFLVPGITDIAHRNWGAFDSVCLVDGERDSVLLTGENGLVYSIDLNTTMGGEHGISVDPKVTIYRYKADMTDRLGSENSPAALGPYLFTADNSGMITCIDTTTMDAVWARDGQDDIDASLVLDREAADKIALYTTCQVDHQGEGGLCHMQKYDAMTGELLWEHTVACSYSKDVNGGSLATPLSGREDIENLIIFCPAKTKGVDGNGLLIAYDKSTGNEVWRTALDRYCWSSPTAVYTKEGKSYILLADSSGKLMMLEGTTGKLLATLNLDGNVEGTPAIFDDTLVVGTRSGTIYGIALS
jgi:hypothetical protein